MGRTLAWWLGIVGVAAGSCAARDDEAELRALIDGAEAAAEARDTGFFRDLIGADYVDRRGQRREDLIDSIRGYFLINTGVEVLNRIESVTFAGEDVATVVLQTAIIGQSQGAALLGLDADYYRIELELVRDDGDWQLIGADWSR